MKPEEILPHLPPVEPPGDCVPIERLSNPTPDDEKHISWCDDCADKLAALALADDDVMLEPSVELLRRVKALGPSSGSTARLPAVKATGKPPVAVRRPTVARRPESRVTSWIPWAVAAAAAILLVLVFGQTSNPPPKNNPEPVAQPTVKPILPNIAKTPEKAPEPRTPEPEKPAPEIVKRPEPGTKTPEPTPEKPPIAVKPPEKTPGPSTVTEPKKPEPEPVRFAMLTDVHGLTASGALKPTDLLETGRRARAAFTVDDVAKLSMRESSRVRIESKKDSLEVRLEAGEVVTDLAKNGRAFVVSTDDASATAHGTIFSVACDGKMTVLAVKVGEVEFGNKAGSVRVKAGFASAAKKGAKPAAPKAMDVDLAWTRTPELGAAAVEPGIDFVPAGPKAIKGLVVSAPYTTNETSAGRIGRRIADQLDCGLVVGYGWRDRERKIWVNIDRTTEGLFDAKGELGKAQETARARKTFEQWVAAMRGAIGTTASLIVTIRNHSEGRNVVEAATNLIDRRHLEEVKALFEKRLKEKSPTVKLALKLDALDSPEYEFEGAKIKFKFTESDAKTLGYMQSPYSKKAITLFLPTLSAADEAIYADILAELTTTLAAHK